MSTVGRVEILSRDLSSLAVWRFLIDTFSYQGAGTAGLATRRCAGPPPPRVAGIDFKGHHVTGYHRLRPLAAVDMLGEGLTAEQLAALKVRSGEHVGAIVATMIHFVAPRAVDDGGGPDLEFEPSDTWERPGVDVAYEIKSIAGDFREFDARLGDPGAPQEFSTMVRTIDDIVGQASDVVRSADETLAGKVSADSSRNVILVLHPLDGFPIEITDGMSERLIGAGLSTSFADTGLDTVTLVVLPPGSIARWTRTLDRWESIIFPSDPDNPDEDDEPPVMTAETEFMARFRPGVDSPYNVRFTASTYDD